MFARAVGREVSSVVVPFMLTSLFGPKTGAAEHDICHARTGWSSRRPG